jgi:acyl-CoA dehydrogenase
MALDANFPTQLAHAVAETRAEAALHADAVDRDARLPEAAIELMRSGGLLGAMVPTAMGGGGLTLVQTCRVVEELARSCSATAMVFAMHQIQVACLLWHRRTAELDALLRRTAAEQLLLASATTEKAVSGSVRTSSCAVATVDGRFSLEKEASIMSYARLADAILVTARRAPDAPATDQVLAAVTVDAFELEQRQVWDTLGFRGTESGGYLLRASGPEGAVFPDAFADISRRTMLPVSHALWGHLWVGMAAEAVSRTRVLLRKAGRSNPGSLPANATAVVDLVNRLQELRSLVYHATSDYQLAVEQWQIAGHDASGLTVDSLPFSIRMNGLKLAGSKAVVNLVTDAIEAAGMPAYQAGGPFALGRILRDAHGARVMINNHRLAGANAAWLLVSKDD